MAKPTSLPPDDMYFIYAILEPHKVYLEFTDGSQGTNLTTWQFDGSDNQQWQLTRTSDTFTIKNVRYNSYMSHSDGNPFVVESLAPYGWNLRAVDGGYQMSNDSAFSSTVNIANGVADDNNPVITFPIGSTTWVYNRTESTTPSPTANSGGLSKSDQIALGVGIGLGIPSLIATLVGLWFAYIQLKKAMAQGT